MNWRTEAACLDADPELFAEQDSHPDRVWAQLERTAAMFCAGCPVATACREEGAGYKHTGMWGGLYRWRREGRIKGRVFVEPPSSPRIPAKAAS